MGFPEKQVRQLIHSRPMRFRYALIAGKKPGIGFIKGS